MTINPIKGANSDSVKPASIPTEEDLFWPAAMREVQTGMMRSAQMAAVAILAWALVGWTVVAMGLIVGAVGRSVPPGVGLAVWLLPLFLWSLAAIGALRVFSVRRYRYFANSPDSTRVAVERIGRKKIHHLYWATGLWAAGMLALIGALYYEILR